MDDLAVLKILYDENSRMTADQILEKLPARSDMGDLYRILAELEVGQCTRSFVFQGARVGVGVCLQHLITDRGVYLVENVGKKS